MSIDHEEYQRQLQRERTERINRRERSRGHRDQIAWRNRNPIKYKAHKTVQAAVADGTLSKPDTCSECGQGGKIEGHHDDYDKVLEVRWLCNPCHNQWHTENGPGLNGDREDRPVGMLDRFEKFADKTFRDAREKYLSEFDGKCLKRQQYALMHIAPYIDDLPLIDVDDTVLDQYKADRRKVAMAGTINKELTTATAVLNKAAKVWRWIPSAPKLQRVKGKHRKPYPLSWHEQIEIFKRLCGDIQKICLFMVNTGVRREEVFKLRWDDFRDIDGVHLFILRDTKNGQDRPVILNSIAQRIVGYMKGRDETHVFPYTSLNKIVNLAWVEAGLPDDPMIKKGVHNLRHTFGYRLRQAGVPGEDRDALLGHHNQSLTQHYAIPDVKRLAELAERVTVRDDVDVLR